MAPPEVAAGERSPLLLRHPLAAPLARSRAGLGPAARRCPRPEAAWPPPEPRHLYGPAAVIYGETPAAGSGLARETPPTTPGLLRKPCPEPAAPQRDPPSPAAMFPSPKPLSRPLEGLRGEVVCGEFLPVCAAGLWEHAQSLLTAAPCLPGGTSHPPSFSHRLPSGLAPWGWWPSATCSRTQRARPSLLRQARGDKTGPAAPLTARPTWEPPLSFLTPKSHDRALGGWLHAEVRAPNKPSHSQRGGWRQEAGDGSVEHQMCSQSVTLLPQREAGAFQSPQALWVTPEMKAACSCWFAQREQTPWQPCYDFGLEIRWGLKKSKLLNTASYTCSCSMFCIEDTQRSWRSKPKQVSSSPLKTFPT